MCAAAFGFVQVQPAHLGAGGPLCALAAGAALQLQRLALGAGQGLLALGSGLGLLARGSFAGSVGFLGLLLGSSGAEAAGAAGGKSVWGDLLVLLAQCSYALYIVLFKNFVGRYSPVTIMKWMFTYSFVCLLPFSYDDLIATEWTALERNALLSLGYIVVGSTFLSYILVIVGQKLLRPTVAGMYNYVQPLVASIVAVCWGMDSFNLSKILSVVLIFGGVYLVTMSRSRADEERTAAAGGGAKEA